MDKILSVVIPSYNVEKYIEKCLDSFLHQDVLKDIEVLIINDGSTDHTAELAQKYVDKYPDTFYLFNKENGGHGSGINYGIEKATGKYFKVIDGDDWVDTTQLPAFIRLLKEHDTDIIATNYTLIEDQTERIIEKRKICHNAYHYGKEWGFAEAVSEPVIRMHAMTVKTSILKENNIRVDEKVFYEDAEFILYPIPYCKNVYYADLYLYMYRLGRSGQSVDINSMKKRRGEHQKVLNSLLNYYEEHQFAQQYKKKYMEKGIAFVVENQFQIYLAMGKEKGIYEEMKEFDQMLLQKYPGIYVAVSKKSIWMIRHSHYALFSIGSMVYSLVKNNK